MLVAVLDARTIEGGGFYVGRVAGRFWLQATKDHLPLIQRVKVNPHYPSLKRPLLILYRLYCSTLFSLACLSRSIVKVDPVKLMVLARPVKIPSAVTRDHGWEAGPAFSFIY